MSQSRVIVTRRCLCRSRCCDRSGACVAQDLGIEVGSTAPAVTVQSLDGKTGQPRQVHWQDADADRVLGDLVPQLSRADADAARRGEEVRQAGQIRGARGGDQPVAGEGAAISRRASAAARHALRHATGRQPAHSTRPLPPTSSCWTRTAKSSIPVSAGNRTSKRRSKKRL